jgi:uncharacterized Zn-binding protein involved in type VI secretion
MKSGAMPLAGASIELRSQKKEAQKGYKPRMKIISGARVLTISCEQTYRDNPQAGRAVINAFRAVVEDEIAAANGVHPSSAPSLRLLAIVVAKGSPHFQARGLPSARSGKAWQPQPTVRRVSIQSCIEPFENCSLMWILDGGRCRRARAGPRAGHAPPADEH